MLKERDPAPNTLSADREFEMIRAGYLVAHEAYQESASRIAALSFEGRTPSAADVAAEATAVRALSAARVAFIDAMSARLPESKASNRS